MSLRVTSATLVRGHCAYPPAVTSHGIGTFSPFCTRHAFCPTSTEREFASLAEPLERDGQTLLSLGGFERFFGQVLYSHVGGPTARSGGGHDVQFGADDGHDEWRGGDA